MMTLDELTTALAARANDYERAVQWPVQSLADFASAGGWRWSIPESYGGDGHSVAQRLSAYAALARGDMSTALFVTQHDGAADLMTRSSNETLKDEWLPRFARGEALTTIGYSQLTTSRQGGAPAMAASRNQDGFVLEGVMPWVTGAPYVTNVACGAALEDGTQLLALVPMDRAGAEVVDAEPLAALNSTYTCEVLCHQVQVTDAELIAGPVEHVLRQRSTPRLLLVSATGTGLARAMVDEVRRLAPSASGLETIHTTTEDLVARLDTLAVRETLEQIEIDTFRAEVNNWLVRLAGFLMTTAKGSGFRRDANAQRLATEAMFFCVWSASGTVRDGTVEHLLAR